MANAAADGASADLNGPQVAVTTEKVLLDEYRLVWPNRPQPLDKEDYYKLVQQNEQAALCLSGGGIRSASFALGILQALSKKQLLTGFHYLSTVSGGGYIGAWLQRWISVHPGGAPAVMEALGASCRSMPAASPTGEDGEPQPADPEQIVEPRQIKALRENSNFITPRVGIGSNDTWTAISISIRNIAVNWLLFAPLFLLVVMVPNLFASILDWIEIGAARLPGLVYLPFILSLICAAMAAWHTCRAIPSYRKVDFDVCGAGDGWLNSKIVKWLVLWALLGTLALWPEVSEGARSEGSLHHKLVPDAGGLSDWIVSCIGFAAISLAVAFLALVFSGARLPKDEGPPERDFRPVFWKDFWLWLISFAIAALTIPVGCELFGLFPAWILDNNTRRLLAFAFLAPLWLMTSQLMVAFVFAAFRRNVIGSVNTDADREWLARLSAVKFKQMLSWGVLAFATLILIHVLGLVHSAGGLSWTSLIAAVSGATAVLGGRGQKSGNTTESGPASVLRFLPLQTIITAATFVFVLAMLALFSVIEQRLAGGLVPYLSPTLNPASQAVNAWLGAESLTKAHDKLVLAHILIGLAAGVILLLLDRRIPVNRFSLNGLYRNRLSRAFLGGARPGARKPDPFTGFDPKDNIDLSRLRPREEGEPAVLYPVVNVALNVTKSKNLAWQERKAASFILSPLYCGSDALFREGESPDTRQTGAYIDSRNYGGSEPEQKEPQGGISLATAISISGAAASPNMGYHSSPATAFLMTLFNVRLGQWMPNPGRAKTLGPGVYRSNPTSSLRALLRELGGSTDDQGLDIYLSDGGHFENLGLYEMVRRRCRYIVVSDAGCDPDCDFSDLGAAVRKSLIDLGANIVFRQMRISSRGKPIEGQVAWAIGDICYGDGHIGQILYIKPSFFETNLPVDVVSYAAASASFPHETTGDQFFSESQFESYRKLGFTFGTTIIGDGSHASIADFFTQAGQIGTQDDAHDKKLKAGLREWLRGLLR